MTRHRRIAHLLPAVRHRPRPQHMQGIGAVVVVGFREMAQLADERRLFAVQLDQTVRHMRLQGLDAQHLVAVRADRARGDRDALRGAAADKFGAEKFLKLYRLNKPHQAAVALMQGNDIADDAVGQTFFDLRLDNVERAALALVAADEDGRRVAGRAGAS